MAATKDKKTESAEPKETPVQSEAVNQEATGEGSSYVAKLSIKALGCDPRLAKGQTSLLLCRIYGTAKGLKHGEDNTTGNVWTALQGEFEGVNCEPESKDYGKTLRSGKLFLPSGIQDIIESTLKAIENTAGGAAEPNVNFALEIRSVTSTNKIGYSYEARNIIPTQARDPLAEMRTAIEAKAGPVKRLEAPKS